MRTRLRSARTVSVGGRILLPQTGDRGLRSVDVTAGVSPVRIIAGPVRTICSLAAIAQAMQPHAVRRPLVATRTRPSRNQQTGDFAGDRASRLPSLGSSAEARLGRGERRPRSRHSRCGRWRHRDRFRRCVGARAIRSAILSSECLLRKTRSAVAVQRKAAHVIPDANGIRAGVQKRGTTTLAMTPASPRDVEAPSHPQETIRHQKHVLNARAAAAFHQRKHHVAPRRAPCAIAL